MIERQYLGGEKPLKKVLSDLFPEIPYSELRACLRRRDVKVDGVRASIDDLPVSSGATIVIYPKNKKQIKIFYEDDNILVCYKPKGIASEGEVSFETAVRADRPEARLTHRLDTNTDGVILFSKTDLAYDEIYTAMKEGRILKEYRAEVYGHPAAKGEVSLDYYYKKDAEQGRALLSDKPLSGYVPVHISFSVLESKPFGAVLRVFLHKGKTHQIRAMLARYGHFILGDGKYGDDEINRALKVKKTLLTAFALRFSFPEKSPLSYLNTITISL